jgi:hypothetical protein
MDTDKCGGRVGGSVRVSVKGPSEVNTSGTWEDAATSSSPCSLPALGATRQPDRRPSPPASAPSSAAGSARPHRRRHGPASGPGAWRRKWHCVDYPLSEAAGRRPVDRAETRPSGRTPARQSEPRGNAGGPRNHEVAGSSPARGASRDGAAGGDAGVQRPTWPGGRLQPPLRLRGPAALFRPVTKSRRHDRAGRAAGATIPP